MTTAIASGSPSQAHPVYREVEALLDLFGRLSAVLKAEIEAVRSQKPDRLRALAAEKETLNQEYQSRMSRMAPLRDRASQIAPDLITRLRDAGARLKALLDENARIINAARLAHESLIKSIADAVTARNRPVLSYGRNGILAEPITSRDGGAVPIALNQEI